MLQLIYARDSSEATASQGVTEYLITTYFFPSSDLRNETFFFSVTGKWKCSIEEKREILFLF